MSEAGPAPMSAIALAVPDAGALGRYSRDVVAQVRRNALEPADGDRLSVYSSAPAGRLAGPVAGAAEDAREDVGFPVEQVGLGVASLGDQPEVFRHIGVRRTGPLAVYDLMVVLRIRGVGVTGHAGLLTVWGDAASYSGFMAPQTSISSAVASGRRSESLGP